MSHGDGDFQGARADVYDKDPHVDQWTILGFNKLVSLPGWSPEGSKVIDYGCGTCNYAVKLAEAGADVLGLDVSERMVQLAQEKVSKRGLQSKIELQHISGDPATHLQGRGLFDAAVVCYVLHHAYEHIDSILRALSRALKPGGKLCVLELQPTERTKATRDSKMKSMAEAAQHSAGNEQQQQHAQHGHHHHGHGHADWLPEDDLKEKAQAHGLKVEHTEPFTAHNGLGEGLTVDCYAAICTKR